MAIERWAVANGESAVDPDHGGVFLEIDDLELSNVSQRLYERYHGVKFGKTVSGAVDYEAELWMCESLTRIAPKSARISSTVETRRYFHSA